MRKRPEGMIRARIAESIVEEMLRDAGYQVYRFGYDSVLETLEAADKVKRTDPVGMVMSEMPDFLAVKNRKPHYIEVKFRSSGRLYPREFGTWGVSRVLLVTPEPPYFQISTFSSFQKSRKLFPLSEDRFLVVPYNTIERYAPLVKKYLAN